MKKSFIAILIVLMMFACMIPVSASINEKELNAPYGTPVIDGVKDEIWDTCEPVIAGTTETEAESFFPGHYNTVDSDYHSMKVYCLWDEEFFYVLYEVIDEDGGQYSSEDPNAWQMDSVDFYFDEIAEFASGSLGTYGLQLRAMTFLGLDTGDQFQQESLGYGTGTIYYRCARTVQGYNMELSYAWQYIEPKVGDIVAADFQGNNNDGNASTYASWIRWNSCGSEAPYANGSAFGTVNLVAAVETEEEAEEVEEEPEIVEEVEEVEEVVEEEVEVVVEEEEEEEEEVVVTTTTPAPTVSTKNPTTSDISFIFYALAAVSAIGGVSIYKKK